jgi:hypothetical protein
MMKLVLDIETAGALTPEMESFLCERIEVNKSLKDPEKITADKESKKAVIIEKAALKATRGKIIVIGIQLCIGKEGFEKWSNRDIFDEIDGLNTLWECFARPEFKTLITFNGFGFDLPYCIQRSMMLGIKVPANVRPLFLSKYKDHHVDLMQLWTCGVYGEYVTLKELCIAFGIIPPVGDGADVPRLYAEGKMDDIVAHCRDDLRATKELYERMT